MSADMYEEVEKVLDKIRYALKDHHGDLKVININDGVVYLKFEGECSDCPVVDMSIKKVVDIAIKGNINWVKRVEILQSKVKFDTTFG